MKIAVVGAGSIGLYYGGHLARANADIRFLMRSGYELAREKGIAIHSADGGDFAIRPVKCARDSVEIGGSDVVIISLKATSNAALDALLPPLIKSGTLLLTLQNGLGNEEYLAARWGKHRVLGGLCFVCLTRRDPVTVDHFGHGTLSIGEYAGGSAGAAEMLAELFRKSGIDAAATENLLCERWRKLVWNIPFNGLSVARGGIAVDKILGDPALYAEARALMSEVIGIAAAEGCKIGEGFADFQIERTRAMGPYKPSTLVDWLEGRELEIEPIWGEPLRRAAVAGVSAPRLQALYGALLSA